MVQQINHERCCHIITLEEPIEYVHPHGRSLVNQREIPRDSPSFAQALRAALRQDPDVLLVGEVRDLETMATALTAAETGHLVLTTLHTNGAAQSIERIIDIFPAQQQPQARRQLSLVLQGIVSLQLLPRADGQGRVAAVEILVGTPAVRNLIREGKTHQVLSLLQAGAKFGMQDMDTALCNLYAQRLVSFTEVRQRIRDPDSLQRLFGTAGR